MSSGELGASSFEFYEGIRILIPGAACVGLYSGVVATFGLAAPTPHESIIGALIATLIAGLLLHFIDLPSRSTVYRSELPDVVLEEWKLPSGLNRVNFYFVLLDTDIPSGIRNRALYMGSMFRIGYELIYLLFATAVCVVTLAFLIPGAGPEQPNTAVVSALWTGAALFAALFLTTLGLDLYRPRGTGETVWIKRKRRLRLLLQQLSALDCLLLMASLALAGAYQHFGFASLAGAAVAVPGLAWAVRFQRGYLDPVDRRPTRLSSPVAALWYCWTGVMLSVLAALNFPAQCSLGIAETVAWLGSALFAGVLMVSRGPEKKLRGSYSTQRTWLRLNEEKLKQKYLSPPEQASA
jgi:hypothetical protein